MSFHLLSIVFLVGAFFALCHAAAEEDLIKDLPGLPSQPSFKQYSGYLKAFGTRKLHYWFVESSSNPKVDPLVLWMNGGPGCSSLDGLLTEHGPFRVNPDGKTLKYNPHTWNQVANMLYLEAPAGVGFSYSADKNYTVNDDEAAANNLAALKDFFSKFSEFKQNNFYITGESYGGIYVPTLVSDVIDDGSMNLVGFAVGNGLSDTGMNDNSAVFFAYYHGLVGEGEWSSLVKACCPKDVADDCDFAAASQTSLSCSASVGKILEMIWSEGLDPYNLYADCPVDNSLHYDANIGKFVSRNIMKPFTFLPSQVRERKFLKSLPGGKLKVAPPCINDTAVSYYLNSQIVRTALHIPAEVQKWEICFGIDYHKQYNTMAPFYKKALDRKLRILVYNGDVDMACNFLGDEWFVDSLHPKTLLERRPWYFTMPNGYKAIAGFVKTFELITFVTIKGAGHMVPSDKPVQSLEMFINFIQFRPF